jgi:Ankyrin repeats (3 copies)
MSPQNYLDALMRNRRYSVERVNTVETAYRNKPTPLQRASYQSFLVNLAKGNNEEALIELLSSGLSPNPANMFGESLLHLVCRIGNSRVLKLLIDCGCELQVCDDYGRTPLHDTCWAGTFNAEMIEILMQNTGESHHLFNMVDSRGSTPLSYIRREHWAEWIQFLESKKDLYWPVQDKSGSKKEPPTITQEKPDSQPLPDPENALSVELASMVASGAIAPVEARLLQEVASESASEDESCYQDEIEYDSEANDDDDDDDDSSSYDEDEDGDLDSSLDEETMAIILQHITAPKTKKPTSCATGNNSSLDEIAMAQILESLSSRGRKPIAWSQ